jgi:hypothetical protein
MQADVTISAQAGVFGDERISDEIQVTMLGAGRLASLPTAAM